MIGRLVAAVLLIAATNAVAVDYFVDGTAGNDANAGTSRGAAWQTWGKMISRINANAIGPDDNVFIRPGLYHVTDGAAGNWLITGAGGTNGHPLTISVDTFYSGNVAVQGSIAPGVSYPHIGVNSRAVAWRAAQTCAGGSYPNTVCDADADCPGGTCSNVPLNTYWTRVDNGNDSTGNTPGTAFQPGANPGDPPKFFEILYSSPPMTGGLPNGMPIQVPNFQAGHDQVWPYTERQDACYGNHNPWPCCLKPGVPGPGDQGCVGGACCAATNGPAGTPVRSGRVYVRTADGTRPDLANPPVEIPYGGAGIFFFNAPAATPTRNIIFTNHGNGRTFYFWWAEKSLLLAENAHDITFEDTDWGYNSGIQMNPMTFKRPSWIASGSGWPRDGGGSYYLIYLFTTSATTQAHHFTWRRSKVHGSAGDELFHINGFFEAGGACTTVGDCSDSTKPAGGAVCECASPVGGACSGGTGTCYYGHGGGNLFEDFTFQDAPLAVANGAAPNAVSVAQSWSPPSYAGLGWDTSPTYRYWSPLGGNGQTPSCTIDQAPFETYRRVNTSNCCNFSAEDATNTLTNALGWGWLVEDSTFDFAMCQHGASSHAPHVHPNMLVTQCDLGPDGTGASWGSTGCDYGPQCCNGYGGDVHGLNFLASYWLHNVPGTIFRNNIVKNGWGKPFGFGINGASLFNPNLLTPNVVVGNTFHLKSVQTDYDSIDGAIQFTQQWNGIWEDNIVWQELTNPAGLSSLLFNATQSGVTLNNNDYFGTMIQSIGGTDYATLAAYQAGVQAAFGAGQEANSLAVDPIFVGGVPYNYDIQGSSPLRNAGVNTPYLTDDIHGTPRPQELITDIGSMEIPSGAVTTTTVSTTTTSSSSTTSSTVVGSTTSTTSTSTSTTLSPEQSKRTRMRLRHRLHVR